MRDEYAIENSTLCRCGFALPRDIIDVDIYVLRALLIESRWRR